MIHHLCSVCGAEMDSPATLAGAGRPCPECSSRIKVPLVSQSRHGENDADPDLQVLLDAAQDEIDDAAGGARTDHARIALTVLRRHELLGWSTLRTALGQLLIGAALVALGVAGLLLFDLVQQAAFLPQEREGLQRILRVVFSLSAVDLTLGAALVLAGLCISCMGPASTGTRGWAIAALVCLGMVALLVGLSLLAAEENAAVERENLRRDRDSWHFGAFNPGDRPQPVVRTPPPFGEVTFIVILYVAQAMSILQAVVFLLFLRRTAVAAGSNSQHIHVLVYLAVFVVFAIVEIMLTQGLVDAPAGRASPLVRRLVVGIIVVLIAWLAVLVGFVRGAVTRMISHRYIVTEPKRRKPAQAWA